jgi:acyl carrier protein
MVGNFFGQEAQASFQDTPTRVRQLIAGHLEVDPVLLRDDADFLNDLGADWLDVVEIIATIETEFGMEFDDGVIDKLKLVGDLIGFVERSGHR